MNSIQFEVVIEAEKDTDLWIIPPYIYKQIMEESAPVANYTNEIMAARSRKSCGLMEQVMWKAKTNVWPPFCWRKLPSKTTNRL